METIKEFCMIMDEVMLELRFLRGLDNEKSCKFRKSLKEALDGFCNKKPSRDSQILIRNLVKYLEEKGLPVPIFSKAAHHIVAISAVGAAETRALLKKYGIGADELN